MAPSCVPGRRSAGGNPTWHWGPSGARRSPRANPSAARARRAGGGPTCDAVRGTRTTSRAEQERADTMAEQLAERAADLLTITTALRDAVAGARFPLDVDGVEEARRAVREVVDQLDDYALPRLRDLDAPLLVVVGGSTGAGKSTLVNSLLGVTVTRPGVLRPTTRSPVLDTAPADREAFTGDRVLPGLARPTGGGA